MKGKTKNPLTKRISRELIGDWRKYLVVSLFLILTIGFVSGMYVANESMLSALNSDAEKYKLESGHFELDEKANPELLDAIASGEKADVKDYYLKTAKNELDAAFSDAHDEKAYDEAWSRILAEIDEKYADAEEKYELNDAEFRPVPVMLYENFYRDEEEDNNNDGVTDGSVRVYVKTDDVNLACLMDGRFPEKEDEIAIDRMHADNVGLKVGDTITVGKREWKVVGLIAYVNYSTLHEKSTDMMFDALKFNVAMTTKEGFDSLKKPIHYVYAWQYKNSPKDEKEEKKLADDFLKALLTQTVTAENELADYIALEYKAYRVIAVGVPVAVFEVLSRAAVDDKVALGVLVEAADDVEHCGFSAAGRTQD